MKVNKILNFLNTARLLRRVNKLSILENGIIEEREELLETIRLLSRRLSLPISHYCTMAVQSNKGVQLLHRILFLSNGDQHISEAIFEVFALLLSHDRKMNKTHTAISIHISGEKLLEDIIEIHHEDDTLRALGKIIMKELQESSAAASLEKIGHVKRALDLGISNIVYKKVFPSAEVCSDNTESVELVLTEMKKHIDNENVQVKGLEVLYKCLDDAECISDFFSCDNFLSIFISAISSKQIHRQRLALSILLTLTCEQHLCERLSAEDDISTLFQLLVEGDNFPQTLKQILLWTLTNLVAEDNCRQKLEVSGLKIFLFQLLSEKEGSESLNLPILVLPLTLRLMYEKSDLEQASYFHISTEKEVDITSTPDERLPRSKRPHPQYGTTEDIGAPGDPGLV